VTAPLISVIIPVYNTAAYLSQCLKSVTDQTYRNLEIIVVDDGSTDDSLSVAQEVARRDERVIVLSQPNGGQSKARNTGLTHATGEYFHFLDSDDYLDRRTIEHLHRACVEHDALLAVCKFTKEAQHLADRTGDGSDASTPSRCGVCHAGDGPCTVVEGGFAELVKAGNRPNYPVVSACMKLYQRSLFEGLGFPEGRIYEDAASYLLILERVKRYVLCEFIGYYYRTADVSTTVAAITRKHFDILKSNRMQVDLCRQRHPEALPLVYANCLNNNDFVAMNCVLDGGPVARELFEELLRDSRELSRGMFPRSLLYRSGTVYRVVLRLMSRVYYDDRFRNLIKRILAR